LAWTDDLLSLREIEAIWGCEWRMAEGHNGL